MGTLPENLEPLPPLPALPASLDAATALAIQRNPRITSAQFAERAAVYDFDRALAAKGPSVSVTASVGAQRDNQQQQVWDGATFSQVGIAGSMPLYTGGRNDSLVRQAQAVLDQRRFEVQDEARAVTQEVAQAWSELEVARASIVARREQVEAARIAAEGVAEEARLGARSTLDVLDADQERLQAEAEVVQALRDEYVATYSAAAGDGAPDRRAPQARDRDLRPGRQLPAGPRRAAGRLRHLRGRPHPRALAATEGMATGQGKEPEAERKSLAEVLASIRALVSAETEARTAAAGEGGGTVLMLTPEMRARRRQPGCAEGLESRRGGRRRRRSSTRSRCAT